MAQRSNRHSWRKMTASERRKTAEAAQKRKRSSRIFTNTEAPCHVAHHFDPFVVAGNRRQARRPMPLTFQVRVFEFLASRGTTATQRWESFADVSLESRLAGT